VAIGADPEFLDTLGVQPAMGRNIPGSGSKLKDPSVLISHRLWVRVFHSDPQVIGRAFTMDGSPSIVAGVLPASFQFPRSDASYFSEEPDLLYPVADIADSWGRGSKSLFPAGGPATRSVFTAKSSRPRGAFPALCFGHVIVRTLVTLSGRESKQAKQVRSRT
jgi:hypothetical protein